jgi:hypothetical protein
LAVDLGRKCGKEVTALGCRRLQPPGRLSSTCERCNGKRIGNTAGDALVVESPRRVGVFIHASSADSARPSYSSMPWVRPRANEYRKLVPGHPKIQMRELRHHGRGDIRHEAQASRQARGRLSKGARSARIAARSRPSPRRAGPRPSIGAVPWHGTILRPAATGV